MLPLITMPFPMTAAPPWSGLCSKSLLAIISYRGALLLPLRNPRTGIKSVADYAGLSRMLDFAELVAAAHQIDAVATKLHAFRTETQPLLQARFSRQTDLAARAQHAMPGYWLTARFAARPQRPNHLPRRPGMSARRRDIAVSGDLPFRNPPHRGKH